MTNELSQKIRNVSFLLMIMVVFLHSYNLDTKQMGKILYFEKDFNWFLQTFISNGFTRIAVPLFFIISGYLFVYDKKTAINELQVKIKKRIKTLLTPYFLWTILGLLVYLLLQSIPFSKPFFTNKLIIDYTFLDWVEAIIYKPIPYQFWFIRDLIVMVFLSPAIIFLVKRIKLFYLLAVLVFWILNQDTVFLTSEALLFFSTGIYIGLFQPQILEMKTNKGMWLFILWFLLLFIKTSVGMLEFSQKLEVLLLKSSILVGVLSFWLLYDTLTFSFDKIAKQITALSWASFFIYAFHEPLLTIMKKAIFYGLAKESASYLLVYFVSPILTIAISILSALTLKRYFFIPYKLLTGNR